MSESIRGSVYAFEGFRLDAQRRVLFDAGGQPIPLTPRLFDTLLYLVEHAGQLLTKEQLLEALWPNVVVEEHNLNKTISELRRVLGEKPGEHRFVVTKPGRGYRFVCDVSLEPRALPEPIGAERDTAARQAPASAAPQPVVPTQWRTLRTVAVAAIGLVAVLVTATLAGSFVRKRSAAPAVVADRATLEAAAEKSVAVLPFADHSEGGNQQWLADGLTEEILNSLARLSELKVTARTSSFQFRDGNRDIREIAATLGVAYAVEGSVRRIGDELRVTAQLIRVRDGFHAWSNVYDGTTSDLLDFERDVAEKIAAALDVVLDDNRREQMFRSGTRNAEAFEVAQRGWAIYRDAHRFMEQGQGPTLWDANVYFERAMALDERYAEAAIGRMDGFIHQLAQPRLPSLVANSPYSQEEALGRLLETLDFMANSRSADMRLVAEITREIYSPTWYQMTSLLARLRQQWDSTSFHFVGGVDGAMHLPKVLHVMGHHDLARKLADTHVRNDPLAGEAWTKKFFVELHTRQFDSAKQVLREARRTFGPVPILLEYELYLARLEGDRDQMIELLGRMQDRRGAALLLAAMNGDREAAMRQASELEGVFDGMALTWLINAYHEMGETERVRAILQRIDQSPAGSVLLLGMLHSTANVLFADLDATPNFRARLMEANIDPARFERMPRLSIREDAARD